MELQAVATIKKEPGEKNFSCYLYVEDIKTGVLGLGSSARAAIADMQSGWQEQLDDYREEGKDAPKLNISYKFDIGSMFNYYDFINMAGLSRELGISPSLMRQYAIGARKPSEQKKEEIASGLKRLANKIAAVDFL